MGNELKSLKMKYSTIKKEFQNQINFTASDISMLFPNLEKSTIYWMISKMVKEGYLKRIRNGVYSLNELKAKTAVYLSKKSKSIGAFLGEEGIEYYFSGIEVIIKFMQHVPEEYPSILFVEKNAENDVMQLMKKHHFIAVKASIIKELDEEYVYTIMRPDVILYFTDNFDYSDNNVALTEKAFIDLFYAITRNQYPMALQELGRTYGNMVRLGVIDLGKMVTISYKRSLQYDIRYIVESKYVSEGAKEIIKYIE